MPGAKWQDPKIEKRNGWYGIRPYVPMLNKVSGGVEPRQKWHRLGRFAGPQKISQNEAEKRKQKIMAVVNNGKTLFQSQIQFSQIIDEYEKLRLPKLRSTTQAKYTTYLARIRKAFGELRTCDIDKRAVETWLTASEFSVHKKTKAKIQLSNWTLQDMRNTLAAVFTAAEDMGLWEGVNPAHGRPVGGTEPKKRVIPKADALIRLLSEIGKDPEGHHIICEDGARLILLTVTITGLRISEVLGLKIDDLDRIAETLRVDERWARGDLGDPKTKKSSRTIQAPLLVGELLKYAAGKEPEEFLFVHATKGGPIDDRDLQKNVIRPALESAGIYRKGAGAHLFRHLNVTWRRQGGANTAEVGIAVGHSTFAITDHYTHAEEERERAHVMKILEKLKMGPGKGSVN